MYASGNNGVRSTPFIMDYGSGDNIYRFILICCRMQVKIANESGVYFHPNYIIIYEYLIILPHNEILPFIVTKVHFNCN